MADEPLYDYTDSDRVNYVVRVIPGTGNVGGRGLNFSVPVTDLEDEDTGERFHGVPWAALRRRKAE